MTSKELIRRVTDLVQPICLEKGVELWDVTFEKEGRSHILTVFIDKAEGVFIEDCEAVSRALDPLLDAREFDSLPAYTLSVSSAGLERRLTRPAHFEWAKGKAVELTFYRAYKGQNGLVGLLREKNEQSIVLTLEDGSEEVLDLALVASVRLYFTF